MENKEEIGRQVGAEETTTVPAITRTPRSKGRGARSGNQVILSGVGKIKYRCGPLLSDKNPISKKLRLSFF